jgi:aryl-alcohol dehydrogenase-like predicted oxidoreductase
MISGRATAEGTARFRERFAAEVAEEHFRRVPIRPENGGGDLWLSSIGLGTYLGDPSDEADAGYEEAVVEALASGCNVLDTAINYRHQRSERAIGRAVARAIEEGVVTRDEIFISTKGGFLPFDGDLPADPAGWLRATWIESGLLAAEEVAAGCHAMSPRYLRDQLARSRENLGLETVDLYYLHNPETQAAEVDAGLFADRLRQACEWLAGEARSGGAIARYGLATWNAFRSVPGDAEHLDLAWIAELLPAEARPEAIQLPLNLAMPEALVRPTQQLEGVVVPAVTAARHFELAVFTSASILQGRLRQGLPSEIAAAFPGWSTDAQRALQFTRSAPGVTTALVGMGRSEHVGENLALAGQPPAGPETYRRLFGGSG